MEVIGIDVSKRFHVAHCDGQELTFSHSQRGFKALVKWMDEVGAFEPLIGMEPTGRYTQTLNDWLVSQGYRVVIVPGVYVNRAKRLWDQGSNKTDRIDALVIAELVKMGRYRVGREKSQIFAELRQLSTLYFRTVQTNTQRINRLHALVDTIFPELTRHIGLDTKTALVILKLYAHPSEIAASPFESFVFRLKQEGAPVTRLMPKLKALWADAGESIGKGSETSAFEIGMLLQAIEQLRTSKAEIVKQIEGWVQNIDYAERLQTIPGMTPLTVGLMLGELGDLSSFQSVNQVYKLAGVNIIERSSGQFQSRRFISKDGRPMLRTHLFNIALKHCTHTDGAWYQWYTERKESKPAKVLFIATIRRLLRICYAVVCSGVGVYSSRLA